jgi:hypothetical protein
MSPTTGTAALLRATTGHAAAPPSPAMNSRRRIQPFRREDYASTLRPIAARAMKSARCAGLASASSP